MGKINFTSRIGNNGKYENHSFCQYVDFEEKLES